MLGSDRSCSKNLGKSHHLVITFRIGTFPTANESWQEGYDLVCQATTIRSSVLLKTNKTVSEWPTVYNPNSINDINWNLMRCTYTLHVSFGNSTHKWLTLEGEQITTGKGIWAILILQNGLHWRTRIIWVKEQHCGTDVKWCHAFGLWDTLEGFHWTPK